MGGRREVSSRGWVCTAAEPKASQLSSKISSDIHYFKNVYTHNSPTSNICQLTVLRKLFMSLVAKPPVGHRQMQEGKNPQILSHFINAEFKKALIFM